MDWLMEPPDAVAAARKKKSRGVVKVKAPLAVHPLSADRWVLYQKVWGEGFNFPGGPDYALELVKPFNLKPAMTVLDLTAGLGGGARAMVEVFDMWVSCMEPDAEIAAVGKAISVQKGVEKRAPMEPYDISKPLVLPPAKYDCILLRETLHEFVHKPEALKAIKHALKPHGQVSSPISSSPTARNAARSFSAGKSCGRSSPTLGPRTIASIASRISNSPCISSRRNRRSIADWSCMAGRSSCSI